MYHQKKISDQLKTVNALEFKFSNQLRVLQGLKQSVKDLELEDQFEIQSSLLNVFYLP